MLAYCTVAEMIDPYVQKVKHDTIEKIMAEAERRIRVTIRWRLRQNLRKVKVEAESALGGRILILVKMSGNA